MLKNNILKLHKDYGKKNYLYPDLYFNSATNIQLLKSGTNKERRRDFFK